MWPMSTRYLDSLRGPHTAISLVDLQDYTGTIFYAGLPFSAGSVVLDRTADVRGRLDLTIPATPDLIPGEITDLLAPAGHELKVYRGIQWPDTYEVAPLGVFRIDSVQVIDTDRSIKISGFDRSLLIKDSNLEDVVVIAAGTNYVTAIASMITGAAGWIPMSFAATSETTPLLVFDDLGEGGRWKAAQDMAAAIGRELFFDGEGLLVLRDEADPGATPVWNVDDGEDGVIVKTDRNWSRDKSYNAVIATSSGNTLPYRAISKDDDPTSPTYYLGPFGKKPRRYSSPFINSTAQAQSAADALLRRSLGITQSLNLDAIPNPALEPGDVVGVRRTAYGINENAVIDRINIGLRATDGMNLEVRARQVLV